MTRQAVLDYLVREADMDGLVTVTEREIGAALGVSQTVVSKHVRNLAAQGLLEVVGWADTQTPGSAPHAIRLAESVYA